MLLRIVKVATGFIEGDRGDLCGRQSARGPGAIARHYRVRYGTVVDEGNRCACAHPGPIRIESVLIQAKTSSVRRLVLVDRKSTRLNSSHSQISYAVFCL